MAITPHFNFMRGIVSTGRHESPPLTGVNILSIGGHYVPGLAFGTTPTTIELGTTPSGQYYGLDYISAFDHYYVSSRSGLYRTQNENILDQSLNTGYQTGIFHGSAYSEGLGLLFTLVHNNGYTLRSSNGVDFTTTGSKLATNALRDVAASFLTNHVIVVGQAIARYTSNGTTWTNATGLPNYHWFKVLYTGTNRVILSSITNSNIYYSDNYTSWTSVGSGLLGARAILGYSPPLDILVAAGAQCSFSYSTDNGASWQAGTVTEGSTKNINSICWSPLFNRFFASATTDSASTYPGHLLYQSLNGMHWDPLSISPSQPSDLALVAAK